MTQGWFRDALVAAMSVSVCVFLSLILLEDVILGRKTNAKARKKMHDGAYYYSHRKGLAIIVILLCACTLEMHDGALFLQPLWDSILYFGQPYVSNWAFAGTLATVSFLMICLYFTYLDFSHSASKVQKDYWPSAKEMWSVAWPQLLVYAAGQLATWYPWVLDPKSNSVDLPKSAPPLGQFIIEFICMLLAGDFLIYWHHRIMHFLPYFRKHIHNVHHTYGTCFSWAGGWVHPFEDFIVILTQVIPILLLRPHSMSIWFFSVFWVICLVDEHSGHDVWWSPYQLLPFTGCPLGGGGAPHDIHHYKPTVNYGFIFIIWDRIFGTFEEVTLDIKNPYRAPFARERKKKQL